MSNQKWYCRSKVRLANLPSVHQIMSIHKSVLLSGEESTPPPPGSQKCVLKEQLTFVIMPHPDLGELSKRENIREAEHIDLVVFKGTFITLWLFKTEFPGVTIHTKYHHIHIGVSTSTSNIAGLYMNDVLCCCKPTLISKVHNKNTNKNITKVR